MWHTTRDEPDTGLPYPFSPSTPLSPAVVPTDSSFEMADVRDENRMEVDQVAENRLSPEAAYGHAHARMVRILEQNGAPAPHALASELLNDLTRDGWKRRPSEPAPPRAREGAPPSETYAQLRARLAAENESRNAEIARREGRALVATS